MQKNNPLYHIAEAEVWEAQKQGDTYVPTDFKREGFIHCSTAAQLPGTAQRFYRGRTDLVLLTLDVSALDIRYENLEGGTSLFPHIYEPLPQKNVLKVTTLTPKPAGDFDFSKI